jgi:TctA family transporter
MPIVALIVVGIVFYILFVRGFAWPLLSLVICFLASKEIERLLPISAKSVAVVLNHSISVACVAAILIWFASVAFFLKED